MCGVSRAMLARVVLAAASALCALGAVVALVVLSGPGPAVAPGVVPAAVPSPVAAPSGPAERATIISVADAVTFDARLDGGRVVRVRALGVQPPGECYGAAATSFARGVLQGKVVDLVSDAPVPENDRFDRRLAHAVLERGDYAVLAAEAGVARSYVVGAEATRMAPVREAQDRARAAGRGLWGPPCSGATSTQSTTASDSSSSRTVSAASATTRRAATPSRVPARASAPATPDAAPARVAPDAATPDAGAARARVANPDDDETPRSAADAPAN